MLFDLLYFLIDTIIIFGLFDLKRFRFKYYGFYLLGTLAFFVNQYFLYSLILDFLLTIGLVYVVLKVKFENRTIKRMHPIKSVKI